jgi:hypothetical protein
MIADIQCCSADELADQIRYLEATPVSGIAMRLQRGQCRLSKGVVRSIADLGALKTEFGQIGRLIPGADQGEKKFLVSEIVPLLLANRGVDDDLLAKINVFLQRDEREIKYNVTVVRVNKDLIIKDGNKRSIAFYERRKSLTAQVSYPVFLVEFVSSSVADV